MISEIGQSFISDTVQCWSCPIFDRMFQVISQAAGQAYNGFVLICVVIFCAFFSLYIFGAVWKNMTKGFQDGWINKSLRPVLINSIFALGFLGMGVMLPRFITTITFEPVAYVTQTYATAMLKSTPEVIEEHVTYEPLKTTVTDGIFRDDLRVAIINIAKVTITQFQGFMNLGIAMLDSAFSWDMFFGIGAFIKHIILAFVGLYLFLGFFKMFFGFLCYFADVIIAMAMFAFFFPISLMAAAFQDVTDDDLPSWLGWIKSFGKGVGVEQIKNLIAAIISLGSAVITYTVILVIIARFFTDPNDGTNNFDALLLAIMNGTVYSEDLNVTGKYDITITSVVVLVYVLLYIYKRIPEITDIILGMFKAPKPDKDIVKTREDLSKSIMSATKSMFKGIGTGIKMVRDRNK